MKHTFRPAPVVTVFGSADTRPGDPEYSDAEELGRLLGKAGFTLCNGGYGGTMEAAARGARSAGGRTIGVVLDYVPGSANAFIDEEIRARDLLERLRTLLERGAAYVVLPGGTGTLAELALALEFNRKGLCTPPRPIILLGDFWLPTIRNVGMQNRLDRSGGVEMGSWFHLATSPAQAVEILSHSLGR